MTPSVEYRLLPSDPGYRVGSDGSVWTCLVQRGVADSGIGSKFVPGDVWRRLSPGRQKRGGRLYVCIRRRTRLVHHLVLEAFVGPRPPGMEGCHNDDDFTNNAFTNLRWDTPTANVEDRIRNGRQARGERHGISKLTAEIVRAIRSEYAAGGVSQARLAKKFGIGQMQVSRIVSRQHWAHVD